MKIQKLTTSEVALLILLAFSSYAEATTINWGGGTGNYDIGTNWINSVAPTAADSAFINSGTALAPTGVTGNASVLTVGNTGTAGLTISGGTINAPSSIVGALAGSNGTVGISTGTWTSTTLNIGNGAGAIGAVNISGGAVSSSTSATIGSVAGGTGSATISGGTWNPAAFFVGNAGNGTLTVSGAGAISATNSFIGRSTGSTSTASISSGTWTNTTGVYVGGSSGTGNGTLNISDTGAVTNAVGHIAFSAGASGTATVSGGTWNNTTSLFVGESGAGTLNLTGGTVTVNSGTGNLTLASAAGSTGVLNVGNGGATVGTLTASAVNDALGTATVNFNHTAANATFSPKLTGLLSVNKLGSGTQTLSGNNTYAGGTALSVGTLVLAHNSAAGTAGIAVSGSSSAILQVNSGITIANNITFSNANAASGVNRLVANGAAYTVGTSGLLASSFAGGQADTSASILAGTSTQVSTTTLTMAFSGNSSATNDAIRKSDVFSLSGTASDTFALQLNVPGLAAGNFIGWLNGGSWVNAVSGNSENNATLAQQGYLGSFSAFQTNYGNTLSAYVGAFGMDTTGGATWAVLNHNSDFAVVPEPSTWVLLAGAGTFFMVMRRRRNS